MFMDFILERNLKASLGLIGLHLEKNDAQFVSHVRTLHSTGRFEIWNHGYDHQLNVTVKTVVNGEERSAVYCEFQNTFAEYQRRHLLKTQALARSELGISITAFGAPGNAFDATTVRVLDEVDEIRVWLFGRTDSTKLVVKHTGSMEQPTGEPNFERFMTDFRRCRQDNLLALQCHPHDWQEAQMKEFRKMIEFMLDSRLTFVLPGELSARDVRGDLKEMSQ